MATSRSLAVNSESPTGGRDEGTAHKLVGNKFANDGSFFEMFRRQMEEKEKSKDMKEETSKDTPVQGSRSAPNRWDVPVEGRTECRAESSSQEGKRKEERTHSKPYQVVPQMTNIFYRMGSVCVCVLGRVGSLLYLSHVCNHD